MIAALAVGLTIKATIVTTINSVDDFQSFATSVNGGEVYTGLTVTLNVDINLQVPVDPQTSNWTPIGTTTHPFTGTFDGGGHTISNLYADGGSNVATGLFGEVASGGTVKDVHIRNGFMDISTNPGENASCHGSIAGLNNGVILGCSNTATVTGRNYEHARIGGIVGENRGSLQNCYNLGRVYSDLSQIYIGGIVGYNQGTVNNCFMKPSVITNGDSEHPKAYPIYGNNGGTVSGCFYMNGSTDDVPYTSSAKPIALANAADNSATLSEKDGQKEHILLNGRTLYADGYWNTLCLPFRISEGASGYSPIAGAKVMTLTSSDLSENTLTLNFENATNIEAGNPYIVKWTDNSIGNLTNPVFMDVTVNKLLNDATTDYADFKGCFSPVTLDAHDKSKLYLSTKDSQSVLYSPGANITINPFRAYFELKNDVEADVKSFFLNFGVDDISDRIEVLNLQNAPSQSEWYTLDGRRLAGKPSKHGVYINSGRKVVIK